MKKVYSIIIYLLVIINLSCEKEEFEKTILTDPSEELVFQNNFKTNYLLNVDNMSEVIETLTWNPISFGGKNVIVHYRVQGSVNHDFSTINYESGSISNSDLNMTVRNLFNLGLAAGLDADPKTTDPNGNPNNTGNIFLRVVSFVGNFDAVNVVREYSDVQQISIEIVEIQCEGSELSTWGFVGPFNGWNVNNPPVYALLTTNTPNVFKGVVTLDNLGFKISVLDGSFSVSYAYGGSKGVLVKDTGFDPLIPTIAGHFLLTADLANLTYTLEATKAYGVIGSAPPNDWNGPNHKFVPNDCETGVYIARNVPMVAGEFYIRANDDWAESYSLGETGEGSFQVNPGIGAVGMPVNEDGNYDIIINFNDSTYQLILIN